MNNINIISKRITAGKYNRASTKSYVFDDYKLNITAVPRAYVRRCGYIIKSIASMKTFNHLCKQLKRLAECGLGYSTINTESLLIVSNRSIKLSAHEKRETIYYLLDILNIEYKRHKDDDNLVTGNNSLTKNHKRINCLLDNELTEREISMMRALVIIELLDSIIEEIYMYDPVYDDEIDEAYTPGSRLSAKEMACSMMSIILSDPRDILSYISDSCLLATQEEKHIVEQRNDNNNTRKKQQKRVAASTKSVRQLVNDVIETYSLLSNYDGRALARSIRRSKRRNDPKMYDSHARSNSSSNRMIEPIISKMTNNAINYCSFGNVMTVTNSFTPIRAQKKFVTMLGNDAIMLVNIWRIICGMFFKQCYDFCLKQENTIRGKDVYAYVSSVNTMQRRIAYEPDKILDECNMKQYIKAILSGVSYDDIIVSVENPLGI